MFKEFRKASYNVEVRVFTTAFKIILSKGKNKQLPKRPSCNLRLYVISEVFKTGKKMSLEGCCSAQMRGSCGLIIQGSNSMSLFFTNTLFTKP